MLRHPSRLVAILVLALGAAACSSPAPSETDQRIAQLEKELEATKKELAATTPAEAVSPDQAVAPAAPPASDPAATAEVARAREQAARDRATAERATKAAEQASRDRAATEQALTAQQQALADQKAASTRQAEEAAELRRQLEEMKPQEFTLPAGTAIPVRTTSEISTKTVKEGSVFDALLERDLVRDGTVLAKAGSHVTCVVASSDPGGKVKGVASLSVRARSIAGVGGNTITVQTDRYSVEAKATAGKDAARTGIATGVGAAIGAIAGGGKGAAIGAGAGAAAGVGATLATRGEAAVIPTETLIEFRLSAAATVVFRK